MYKVHKSTKAEEDLTGIWMYSLQEWSIEQADKYVDELNAGFARLETNPKLGKSRDDLRPGYFSLVLNEHIAYYIISQCVVRIARVLHSQMDPDRHL